MLTAREEVDDRVEGLEAGADDYVAKPFALRELLARLHAVLRRVDERQPPETLAYSGIELTPAARTVTRHGELLALTRTEFSLLELLMRKPGQVLTRAEIQLAVWGYDFGTDSNSLGVFVGYLRRKLGEPPVLQTVRGVGYVLREGER
jgi:two-component system response regulator MprA